MNMRQILVAAAAVLALVVLAPREASAQKVYGSACSGASSWTSNQCDNQINDDKTAALNRDCYGACGYGCTTNCSSGGACETHDYYTRTQGMWSSAAMNAFPGAAAQWGKCVMGAGYSYVSGSMKSAWSGIKKGTSKVVSKIFN